MSEPTSPTSRPSPSATVRSVLDALGPIPNRDVVADILSSALRLAGDDASRLDLKITAAALREMRAAFKAFAPYRAVPKITMFGSARTLPDDPVYAQARAMAQRIADAGWMVVTGAGPGIMAAGMEGAGRERSFGVNIRLPFEQGANAFIAKDPKLVEMKYFFTRKLMLIKESRGFVVLPGGFGTLDESFELFTLLQTGKAEPAPVVLLDLPGGTYWEAWERFLRDEVATRGLIADGDRAFWMRTDSVEAAADEILGFFSNYHSIRYVGDHLVVRLQRAPSPDQLKRLSDDFPDLAPPGGLVCGEPSPAERADNDHLDLARLVLRFDRLSNERLRLLINALNALDPAGGLAQA